jgi:hypothetical protein
MKTEDSNIDIEDLLTQIRDLTLRVARLEQEKTNSEHSTNDNRSELLVGDRVSHQESNSETCKLAHQQAVDRSQRETSRRYANNPGQGVHHNR